MYQYLIFASYFNYSFKKKNSQYIGIGFSIFFNELKSTFKTSPFIPKHSQYWFKTVSKNLGNVGIRFAYLDFIFKFKDLDVSGTFWKTPCKSLILKDNPFSISRGMGGVYIIYIYPPPHYPLLSLNPTGLVRGPMGLPLLIPLSLFSAFQERKDRALYFYGKRKKYSEHDLQVRCAAVFRKIWKWDI